MELPDINQFTEQQWDQLVAAIQQAKVTKKIERQQEAEALKGNITDVVPALNLLIGPDKPTVPSANSLSEMKLYTATQAAALVGPALVKIILVVDKLARAVRDLAKAQADD